MEPEIINPTSFLSEFSKSQKTVDTKDVLPYEFDQGMGELNKYDVGLTPYIPKEENRAQNQDWWQSTRNSLSQLVSGTIGEIVATPGYIAGTFEPIEEMDKGISGLFIEAGEWIKQQGQEFAPLYQSQASREKIFAPWDSEWMAQTIADFGPTVALLASAFFTEGLTTPRLLSLGRQIPGISKYARAAQIFKNESKIYNKLRTVNTTLFSRMAENGMEAYQTFNEVYDGLKSSNPEMSDEDMRKLAGEAGSKVWRENWALIVLDYMQFGALLNGFGKLGKAFGILGKAFGLGEQMASGAFEEGLQYTMHAEAKNEIDFKTGKADRDKTFVETFIEGLTDPEMQKAMVQGALGGAVFQGMGAIANKIGERYRQPLSQSTSEVVNDIVKRGYADVAKADIDKKIAETDDPKLKKHLEGVKASIDKAVEVHQSENLNKDETAKALIKTQVLNNEKTDIEQKIENKKTDTTIQNKSAVDYAKASLASPHLNTLRKKYSKFPKALSIIDKLEQKYNNQRDTLASPEVTDEATHLIPQMKVDVHKAVELELEEEIQKQVATDLAEGNRELHDNLVKEDVKTHISNYTDKEELLKLRESETDAENKKVINSRIKELWQSESKVFPTIEQGADVWAEHYRENLFTFKNDAKNLFKQPNLTIEDFKNKFEEFKPLLEERQKSGVADQKRAISLEEKDKTKIIDIVGKDEKGLTIKQINQRTGKQDKTNLVEQLVDEGVLVKDGNRYKKVEVEDDVPIIVEHSKEEPQPDDIPFDPQWARSNDMLFYAATEVDGKWYINYGNKVMPIEEYEKLGFDKPTLKTGWYPVTKDKEPVKWHQTDVDVEFLRKVYEITGKPLDQHEVHIKVDWNYTNGNWKNRDANKDNFKIYYVIKHDGKEHIIGEVPAYKSGMEEELKSFRYTLYEHAKQEENDYEYPHTLKVKAARSGRVWNTKSRNSDLTIANRGINLGVYSDGKIYGIEQTNLDRVDREDIKSFEGKLTEGAVYWFITHPVTGKIVPIRLFTRKVKDLPNVEKKIKHILAGVNKDNWVDKRREVSRYVKWGTKEKRQPDFGFNKSGELIVNGEVTPIPDGAVIQDVIYDTLDIGDRTIQVDTRRINTKGYNEMLMNEGYIQTDVNQINPFHSPKFKVDYTELTPVEIKKKASNNKEIINNEVVKSAEVYIDAKDRLIALSKSGTDLEKLLATLILKHFNAFENVYFNVEWADDVFGYGVYDDKKVFYNGTPSNQIFLHELVHAITHDAIKKGELDTMRNLKTKEALLFQELNVILIQLQKKLGKNVVSNLFEISHSSQSASEFVASMSKPEMAKALLDFDVNQNTNFFERWFKAILDFLGVKNTNLLNTTVGSIEKYYSSLTLPSKEKVSVSESGSEGTTRGPALTDINTNLKAPAPTTKNEPTRQNVTERLNINSPFYKKVSKALSDLGLIEEYNPETKEGDVLGGYIQVWEKGFVAGDIYFNSNGSVSYIKGDVKVVFDSEGNLISENTKEAKQKATQIEIEGKKESIARLEKLRDSDAFTYKEVTETDLLGNKRKVKRLKTPQELKESTDKINATIDKVKSELAALETSKPLSAPVEVKDQTSTDIEAKKADIEKRQQEELQLIETIKKETENTKKIKDRPKTLSERLGLKKQVLPEWVKKYDSDEIYYINQHPVRITPVFEDFDKNYLLQIDDVNNKFQMFLNEAGEIVSTIPGTYLQYNIKEWDIKITKDASPATTDEEVANYIVNIILEHSNISGYDTPKQIALSGGAAMLLKGREKLRPQINKILNSKGFYLFEGTLPKGWPYITNVNPNKINAKSESNEIIPQESETALPEDILQQISNNALFKLESQHYTTKLWNQKEGQKWLKDKFGEEAIVLSQEELNDLADRLGYVAQRGGKNLWGFVHQGMVYMSELAPESVHRHEAYHLIHNYVLTDSERRAIEKFGTEEEIADAFMEYMQTEDAPYAAWKRVFKKIYLFFKRILALDKMTLDEFFWTFENSTYKSVSFKKNVEVFRPKVEEIHPTIKKQRIRLINKIFLTALGDLKKANPNLKTEDLFRLALGKEDLYGTKVMDRLNEMELNIDNNWKSGFYEDIKLDNGTVIPAEQIYRARKAQIKQVKDNLYKDGKPQQWYYDAVEDLRRYGVFVNTIGGKDIIEGEEDGLETWMKENVKSPAFDSFTFNLKVMLTDIPDAEYVSVADKDKPHVKEYILGNKTVYIKTKRDSFNQTVYMDGDEVYAKLLQHLSDSLSQEDMMNKLEDMSYDYPWAKILYDDLSSENGDYLSGNLNQLKSEMYYRFAQWANTQSIVITPVDGEFRLGYSNEKTLKSNLIREWWDKVNSPSNPLFENKEKQAQTISVLNKLNVSPNSPQKDVAAIIKTMNAVGIETTDEIVKAIIKDNKGQSLQKALVQVVEGNKKGVEIIAGLIKKFYPEYYQPSYVNVEGEKVQNHIRASFMSRQIEKFNRSEGMEVYEGDPFYNSAYDESVQNVEDALWLDRFKTKKGIISFNLVDGFGGVSSKTFADFTPLEFLAYQMGAFYNNGNHKVKSNSENGQAYYSVQLFADSSSHSLIGMETYSKKDILTKLTQVAFNEYDAIQEGVNGVKGYTPKFNFFPFFNQMSESELADVFSNRESVKRMIEKNVTEWIKKEKRTLGEKGFYRQIKDRYEFLDNRIDNVDEFLEDFYWNDIYAQTQIISLFYGNLSYYNKINNFYKRAKEIWAPGDFLDTTRINKEYFIAIVPDSETTNQEVVDFVNKHLEGVGVRYENSSETDGQGIIDIDRWREIQLGKGVDLDWVNGIYDRVAQGVETETDMEYIFMPYKPFMYDLVKHNGQVVPLQVKNSEVVLLPSMAKKNPKLQTILNKLKEVREKTGLNGSLQFDTTVKVGEHNSNKSIETIDNWITLKNSEYRIQGETPEHQVDADNLLGTQLRKIATGDLELDGDYHVGEESIKGKAIKEEMNSILKADVEANAKSLRERFKSKEEFYKSLQEEAISRNYPKKIIDALEPVVKPDGTVGTKLPLYHPLLIKKAFALIASLYRNKITKLKFPGASLPNVTSYGLERKPQVVFNEDGSIQHLECYMPMTNRWLRDYMDKNGFLNVDKLAEFGLDLGVAYRIPTEGKYSMVPIKVIGFTNAGIILPPEITKMTGLDFDIDKMYVMLYSFDIVNGVPVKSKWESEPSYADYKTRVLNTKRAKELIKEYETADAILSNAEGLSDKLRELFLSNSVEDLLIENDILMDESEWNKLSVAERNSKKARDNRKLDLLRSVLTSPHTFKSQMDGGNFDALEKLAHEVGGEFPNVNPLLASERSRVFENMMAGKALIGIGANYVATHQLMQDQNIELVEPLEFDGRVASDLGAKYVTGTNDIVTAALAQFNASFVDNGKNPLAGLYNMNTYTADVAMLFTKLFGWEAAVRFISHPSVKNFYTRYVNAGGDFKAEQKIIDEIFPQVRFTGDKRRKPLPLTMDMLVNKTDGEDVLYAFLYYKKNQAKQLGDLVTAMKVADTGMSSTVEDTLVSLDAIEKAKKNDGISGVVQYFENESLHTTSMVNLGIIEPLDRLRDELEFPDYRQGAYKEIRDVFNDEKESGKLNAKEIRFIHDVMINFMASSFDMFKFNRKAMVKSILPIIEKAKKDNPDNSSKYRKLLSSIKTSASREDSGLQILKLDNGISYNAENDIMEQWEMMFSDSSLIPETDITYSRFAKALVKYAFITKGFRFGPGSFSQVTPINLYAELKNENNVSFTDYIGGMIRLANSDSQSMNNFISQIVRNYFPRLSFVRTVNTEQDVIKKDKEGNIVAILADDRYAKNGVFPSFVKYKDDSKKWHLFQNEFENKYVPITPLGLYNEVEEWDSTDSNPSSDFRQNVSKDIVKETKKISSDYKPVATPVGVAETKDVDLSIKIISKKLFNAADKTLKKGSVVEYNGKKYLFWNENQSGKAQLINIDGTKFSGTPGIDKLVTLGSYPTVMYNNTEYIVTDNNNVYSGATGNLVYTGADNSSKIQKQRIIDAAKEQVSATQPEPVQKESLGSMEVPDCVKK